jgi:glycosyltransferase involved in cell wall biosynthesis
MTGGALAGSLHRAWQCLPYRFRRQLLLATTSRMATPAPLAVLRTEPILIAGYLRAASGLGECARLMIGAYRQRGVQVYGVDLSDRFRQGTEVADFSFVDGRNHRGCGTLILHVNAPFVPLALGALGRALVQDKWRIGYWAWELSDLPPEWQRGAKFVNEIWSLSQFSADAIARGLGRPVRAVLPSVKPRAAERDGTAPFRQQTGANFVVLVVFNMASSFARKNPLGAIAAFKAAFGNDDSALLIIKVSNGEVHPAGVKAMHEAIRGHDNIKLLLDTLSDQGLADLISGADVVLSLHRSEGFGLVLAHAMHFGRPIVATNWSGNLDFLTPRNACLVPAKLVPAEDPQHTYHCPKTLWAEPSVGEAAAFLRRLRMDIEFARAVGYKAKADAEQIFAGQDLPKICGTGATPGEEQIVWSKQCSR